MTTQEMIITILKNDDESSSITQLTKLVEGKLDILKMVIKTIVNQFSKENKSEYYQKLCIILTSIFKKNSSDINITELLEILKETPDEGAKRVNIIRANFGYILAMACISRSDILSFNYNMVPKFVQALFELAHKESVYRINAVCVLLDIIKNHIEDYESFMDSVFTILVHNQPKKPGNVDILYMWMEIALLFPKVSTLDVIKKPLSDEFFATFEDYLKTTAQYNIVHPIWHFLAKIDYNSFFDIVINKFLPRYTEFRHFVPFSMTAIIPYLTTEELVEKYIGNSNLFSSSLQRLPEKNIFQVLQPKIDPLLETDKIGEITKILMHFLTIPREHTFVLKIINESCSKLSDKATDYLVNEMNKNGLGFSSFKKVLWAQKLRHNVNLFIETANKATTDEERMEMLHFLAVNLYRISSNGLTWLTLLSGVEYSLSHVPESVSGVAELTNKLIDAVNITMEKIGIKKKVGYVQNDVDNLSKQLNKYANDKSNPVVSLVAQQMLKLLVPYIDASNIGCLKGQSDLLLKAIKISSLSAAALPLFFESLKDVKYKQEQKDFFNIETMRLPISSEDSYSLTSSLLAIQIDNEVEIRSTILLYLIRMMNEDEYTKLVDELTTNTFENTENKGKNMLNVTLLKHLVKESSITANDIIQKCITLAPTLSKPSQLEVLRSLISLCSESADVGNDIISDAIYAALDYEYPPTGSGKKRCEVALKWAQSLLKKLDKSIPHAKFAELTERVNNTGSRQAAQIIRQISSV